MTTLRDINHSECHIDNDTFAEWCDSASTAMEFEILYEIADSDVSGDLLVYLGQHRPDIVATFEPSKASASESTVCGHTIQHDNRRRQ